MSIQTANVLGWTVIALAIFGTLHLFERVRYYFESFHVHKEQKKSASKERRRDYQAQSLEQAAKLSYGKED